MTFKILTSDTHKVIYRSDIRSAGTSDRNLRAEMERNNTSTLSDRVPPDPNDDDISVSDNHDKGIGELSNPPNVIKSR